MPSLCLVIICGIIKILALFDKPTPEQAKIVEAQRNQKEN